MFSPDTFTSLLSKDDWIALVQQCGWPMDATTLDALIEHDCISMVGPNASQLSRLHLLPLAHYFDAVITFQHPWTSSEKDPGALLEHVNWYAHIRASIDALIGGDTSVAMAPLVDTLDAWLAEHDHFPSPLSNLATALKSDVTQNWRGPARAWIELHELRRLLQLMKDNLDEVDDSATTQIFRKTAELKSPFAQTQQLKVAMPLAETKASSPIRVTAEMDAVAPDSTSFASSRKTNVTTKTPSIKRAELLLEDAFDTDELDNISSATEESTAEEVAAQNDHTAQLKARIAKLRKTSPPPKQVAESGDGWDDVSDAIDDVRRESTAAEHSVDERAKHESTENKVAENKNTESKDAESKDAESKDAESKDKDVETEHPHESDVMTSANPVPDAAPALAVPEDKPQESQGEAKEETQKASIDRKSLTKAQLSEQIKILNKKREQYMRDQNWVGLVALYEDGIDLFGSKDKPQIYVTLSKLYEVKLKDVSKSFDAMCQAFALARPAAAPEYEKHIHRLGVQASVRPFYKNWLNTQLADNLLSGDRRLALANKHAQMMQEGGDIRQGFLSFAAMLTEHLYLTRQTQSLELLESLGKSLDYAEVDEVYLDLYEQMEDNDGRFSVALHAGFSALERDENKHAMKHLGRAFALNPNHEAAFHSLVSVYVEESAWPQLVELYEGRAKNKPDQPNVQARLEEYRARLLESPDDAIAYFEAQLEASPENETAFSSLVQLYERQQRHGELYGWLNRHIERVSTPSIQCHILNVMAKVAVENLFAPEEAELHYQRMINLIEGEQDVLEALIRSCLDHKIWTIAVDGVDALTTDKAMTLNVEEKISWLMLGANAAKSADRRRVRRRFLENVLALQPNHTDAQNELKAMP